MSNKQLSYLTEDDFNYITKNEKTPFVLFFCAKWDENSKSMMPDLEDIGHKHYDNVRIYLCDIDEVPLCAAKSNILSIPCIILYVNGEEKAKIAGYRSKNDVEDLLEKHEVI